jgi:hypothetical protein
MSVFRRFVAAGKPVIGIRTASHAFAPLDGKVPEGLEAWPNFDEEVLGCHYSGHYDERPELQIMSTHTGHPVLCSVTTDAFDVVSTLYRSAPLAKGATVLLEGKIPDHPPEPIAWVFVRADGGRSFYTSLGHYCDTSQNGFRQLLFNGIRWATGIDTGRLPDRVREAFWSKYWQIKDVPDPDRLSEGWYRCYFRVSTNSSGENLELRLLKCAADSVWINGHKLKLDSKSDEQRVAVIPAEIIEQGELNLLAIYFGNTANAFPEAPRIAIGDVELILNGKWQFRRGDDPANASLPLPAKFAASPDVIFE